MIPPPLSLDPLQAASALAGALLVLMALRAAAVARRFGR